MNDQDIIDQFFIQDGEIQPNRRKKRSILLAIIDDLQFCILLYKRWKVLKLSPEQNAELRKILPTFTIVSLFCTAVDLLSRITNKRQPPSGQNGTYFKNCAIQRFGLSQVEADQLWLLRNSISHSYSLNRMQIVIQYGHGRLIRQTTQGYWEFYLHAMYTTLDKAKRDIYDHLSGELSINKSATAGYLTNHGFFYTS